MIQKRGVLRYLLIGAITIVLISILMVLKGGFTGYVVFEDSGSEFDNGVYVNTTYNGSAVVLVGNNLSGTYTSQIFDAGANSQWNNLSWEGIGTKNFNSYLSSAFHLGTNVSQVFSKDNNYYLADMKDSSKNFYLNFSSNLVNNSILKIYAKKNKGVTIGIYAQSDSSGNNPMGTFIISSVTGEWYNITLDMSQPTNAIWIGEGTESGVDPKDEFDYVYAESIGGNLSFQIRNCSQSDCSDGTWQSANLNNLNLQSRYFQYRAVFTSPDSSITPSLNSVNIDYTVLNTPPSISTTSPQNGNTYGYNQSINLNFTTSDSEDNIDACWYNLNNQNNITITNCQNTTFNVSEGAHTLTIFINDTLGEEASDSTTFNVQVGAPTITLSFPINNYLNYNNIQFNYTPTDADLSSCELWGDFTGEFIQNQTDNSPTSGQTNHFQLFLSEGTYIWNIKCTDGQSNQATNGNQTFRIDTTNPQIVLTQPTGKKTSRTITSSWTFSDASPATCLYNVYRGANIEVANTSVNCSATSSTFSITIDADFILNFYITDSAGNTNSTNSSFSVDTSTTPPSSGGSGSSGGGGGGGGGSTGRTITEPLPEIELETSELEEIIAKPGDKKTLLLNVRNTGKKFLNNCKLLASGELSSWIYTDQVGGIAPGESVDFIFALNIPEGTKEDISGDLAISCDEITKSQRIKITLPKTTSLINIKEINHEGDMLNLTYTFDNSQIVGDDIGIEIWITDEQGTEIKKIIDNFPINREGPIERNIAIPLQENIAGIYYIYIAISSDRENFVKQSIVLGKPAAAGLAILDANNNKKLTGYIVFIIIIIGAIFFGVRGSLKKIKLSQKQLKSKNKSLLPKTKKFHLPKLRFLKLFKKK